MKIYTRRGDDGTTGLLGGQRVSKAAARVEAYGLLDELNAALGWARVVAAPDAVEATLDAAQEACFRLGAWLASAPGADPGVPDLGAAEVAGLESAIDALDERLPPLRRFVLPGGGETAARLHLARTVARRVERAVVALAAREPLGPYAVPWLNRLSDWLFTAARACNAHDGVAEREWAPRRG